MLVKTWLFWAIEFGVWLVSKLFPSVSRVLCSKGVLFQMAVQISQYGDELAAKKTYKSWHPSVLLNCPGGWGC